MVPLNTPPYPKLTLKGQSIQSPSPVLKLPRISETLLVSRPFSVLASHSF